MNQRRGPRRIEPISAKRISALREEYIGLIERDYSKQNTKLKLIRGVDQFIKLMEDPPLQSIKAKNYLRLHRPTT